MKKSNCVIEMPDLVIDQAKLIDISNKYEFKPWTPYFGYEGDTSKFQAYFEIRDERLIDDNPYIQDIVNQFNPCFDIKNLHVCFLKFPKGFNHKSHIDINRNAVIYFALNYSNAPTIFELDNEIYKHQHSSPSIINVTIPHRSDVQNDRDRYAFTISIKNHTFDEVKEMKQSKTLYLPGLL